MSDEEQEIVRSNEANALLGNKLLNEALEAIAQRYRDDYENSQLSQRELREEAFRMLSTVKLFRQHLTHFVETGKMASVTRAQRQASERAERELSEWDGSPDGHT